MKKTLFLLTGICMMLYVLPGCQDKPLDVIHHSSYTDHDYYSRTQPYHEYDSVVFADGSSALWKMGHAPRNKELVIKDNKCRKIAVISCGSEVVPIFQLPRYDKEGRLSELLTFDHAIYEKCPFNASWYDNETNRFDLAALRNSIGLWKMNNLPDDAEPVLYKFDYNDAGTLTCVSSSDGERTQADEDHYLTADFVYEPGFWGSDLSGSSHELYITQNPLYRSAEEYVTVKYTGMTKMYEIVNQSEERKQIKVYEKEEDGGYTCLESIDITYGPDGNVYTHKYTSGTGKVTEYFTDRHKTRMEKYDESGKLSEVYYYDYPSYGIVVMQAEKWDTRLGRMVKQTPQKMKTWNDLYENSRLSLTDYVESVYNQSVW